MWSSDSYATLDFLMKHENIIKICLDLITYERKESCSTYSTFEEAKDFFFCGSRKGDR